MTEQDVKYIFKNRDINNRGSYCPMMPNSSCTIQVKTITAKKKTLFEKPAIFRITCVMVSCNKSNLQMRSPTIYYETSTSYHRHCSNRALWSTAVI